MGHCCGGRAHATHDERGDHGDGHEIAGEIHFEVGRGPVGADADAAAEASSSTADPDGGLSGVVVPAIVVLLSGACALVVWRRRRAPGTES